MDLKGKKIGKTAIQHHNSLASQASKQTAGASEVTITTGPKKVNTIDDFARLGHRNSVDQNSLSINHLSLMQNSQPELKQVASPRNMHVAAQHHFNKLRDQLNRLNTADHIEVRGGDRLHQSANDRNLLNTQGSRERSIYHENGVGGRNNFMLVKANDEKSNSPKAQRIVSKQAPQYITLSN